MWAVFVHDGNIKDRASTENPGVDLSSELTQTYLSGSGRAHEFIICSWWLRYDPPKDDLTPKAVFTLARLTLSAKNNITCWCLAKYLSDLLPPASYPQVKTLQACAS